MKKSVLASLFILALGVMACDTPADLDLEADEVSTLVMSAKADQAVGKAVESVTGAGHIRFNEDDYRRMSVTAKKNSDGAVSGQFEFHRFNGPVHGEVTCLTVIGNEGYIGGSITHYPADPAEIGNEFMFMVRDNGEGGNAPPDQITYTYLGIPPGHQYGTAEDFCNLEGQAYENLMAVILEIHNGNIQVRGGAAPPS
jgi:hypothetical protein